MSGAEKLTEEMLEKAAEEAAEAMLAALPGREDCGHEFSTAFEERMRPLLSGKKRPRPWRALLAAAAIIAALAAGFTVGADQSPGTRLYWSQREDGVFYSVRVEGERSKVFTPVSAGYLPEGYVLDREVAWKSGGAESCQTYYRSERDDGQFSVLQQEQQRYSGSLLGDGYQAEEIEIGGQSGVLICGRTEPLCCLIWTDGPYILTVNGYGLEKEEIVQIAENLNA